MARIQPDEADLLNSVWDVVYEYGNLISSGELLQTPLPPPINTHVQDAFLLSCRKMADFFLWKPTTRYPEPDKHDIVASDFTASPQAYTLPIWDSWATAIDKQLAHITWKRDKGWDGSKNKPFMEELRAAWKLFLANLDPKFQTRFGEELAKRKRDEPYSRLDLN